MITGGNNIGRIGILQSMEKHQGSFEIAHVRDSRGKLFSTRLGNVMVVGDNKNSEISLPKGEGIAYNLLEERDARRTHHREAEVEEEEDDEEDN